LAPVLEAPRRPLQAIHGDAHPGNILLTPDGPVWADFEETCLAPVEWDLACLTLSSSAFGDDALAVYGGDVSEEEIELCTHARVLQIAAWSALVAQHDPARRDRADRHLRFWRDRPR